MNEPDFNKIRDVIYVYLSALANPAKAGTYAGYLQPLKSSGVIADHGFKCSERFFNRMKASYMVIHSINPKTGAKMKRPQKLNPDEYTKADLIRNVLRANPDMPREDAGTFYGDETMFSSSQFSTIRTEIVKEQKQLKLFEKNEAKTPEGKTEKKNNGVPKGTRVVMSTLATPPVNDEVSALKDENAYLRWQLEGERAGFFDRWLEEHESE